MDVCVVGPVEPWGSLGRLRFPLKPVISSAIYKAWQEFSCRERFRMSGCQVLLVVAVMVALAHGEYLTLYVYFCYIILKYYTIRDVN